MEQVKDTPAEAPAQAAQAPTQEPWKLVRYETMGTEAYGDDEQTFVGYDNIRVGFTLLTGEDLERFDEDGAPFEAEDFRSVRVVAEGDDAEAFISTINKGRAALSRKEA